MIALVGNPNSGKTTLFNALTGLRQKVATTPASPSSGTKARSASLTAPTSSSSTSPAPTASGPRRPTKQSPSTSCSAAQPHTPPPDLIVCVVDAGNLERNLYLVSQIIDRRLPVVLALNMVDVAASTGVVVDTRAGSAKELGVPVIPMVATTGDGIDELRQAMATTPAPSPRAREWTLPEPVDREPEELSGMLVGSRQDSEATAFNEAIELLTSHPPALEQSDRFDARSSPTCGLDHQKLDFLGFDRESVAASARYAWIRQVVARSTERVAHPGISLSDRIDAVLTHRVWGLVVFLVLMALMFQSIFSWATAPMELIGEGFDASGAPFRGCMPPGALRDLIINGAIAGVAAVVMFLPQILFLFLFLALLEDTGYMARAAFIMDRLMSRSACTASRSSRCSARSPAPSPASWRRAPSRTRGTASRPCSSRR